MREVVRIRQSRDALFHQGKDSSVMLHLAMESVLSRPSRHSRCMHVDTTLKFREMIQFRDETAKQIWRLELIVHVE